VSYTGVDHLLPEHHHRPDAAHHLHGIFALQVSGFGEDHVRVPRRIAHLDIDGADEIHLLDHLHRFRLIGQCIHRILLGDHPSLHRIWRPGEYVLAQLQVRAVALGRQREVLVHLVHPVGLGVVPG
jgi:hypothetical protein